ncbi:sensor histidine kinase [Frankia sp. AgB1.9]|nr:sensor histidine kinase [Frankia sp. AgW1.1]MBL7550316.1 sensor histidine kinase [Frankia sp. AgB1.9]MBL7618132.1 sensor histidine kinase [Frankia sp. AgB1.8]
MGPSVNLPDPVIHRTMTSVSRGMNRKLSTRILINQLMILGATVLIGFVLFARVERGQLDGQYEQRAAAIAQTTAGVPDVIGCLEAPKPACSTRVEMIAERIRRETGASYVVVIDMNRVRHSHPIAALIGQQVSEPIATTDGQTHTGIDNGSTGRSANGKAPISGGRGQLVGEVSAGIRESSVSLALWRSLPVYALWFAVALACGAVASWLLARRLKRQTFGLELEEISLLLQEREATLHGIREGMIALDPAGRVSMINDEARRLLGIGTAGVGRRLDELVEPGRLAAVLTGQIAGPDEVVLTDDYCLTVNRMPVTLYGRPHGAVVTLRDRTEMAGLLRELDNVRGLTESLRAQQHEFSNRMHTVAGLLELGHADEALGYLTELHARESRFGDALAARIGSPLIVGLLVGKAAQASERGIALSIGEETWLGEVPDLGDPLVTIIGNLIDNAFEALSSADPAVVGPGVTVDLFEDEDDVRVRVVDNGPGIPEGIGRSVFLDGFSTKPARGSLRRGLGLALVHRLVQRVGGHIDVSEGPGATFDVRLPRSGEAMSAGGVLVA